MIKQIIITRKSTNIEIYFLPEEIYQDRVADALKMGEVGLIRIQQPFQIKYDRNK